MKDEVQHITVTEILANCLEYLEAMDKTMSKMEDILQNKIMTSFQPGSKSGMPLEGTVGNVMDDSLAVKARIVNLMDRLELNISILDHL